MARRLDQASLACDQSSRAILSSLESLFSSGSAFSCRIQSHSLIVGRL